MRIISGQYKGKIINAPKNLPVRPTTDFAKTALFNILSNQFDLATIQVLDLFAGTGSISYEFLSRGVKYLTAVDENKNCCAFIAKNFDDLADKNAHVTKQDVFGYVKQCQVRYDIIFADPPYDLAQAQTLPALVFEHNLLKPDGLFVFEHQSAQDFSAMPHFVEKRKYGNVGFSIFK